MRSLSFNITGKRGSFTRPHTNNYISTYNVIPKSTLLGIIFGSVGHTRKLVKENNYYKLFTKNIKYSVVHNKPLVKKPYDEYRYNPKQKKYSPNSYEIINGIDYDIHIIYDDSISIINETMNDFINNLKTNSFVFSPSLGRANMPADLKYINCGIPVVKQGEFTTNGFCIEDSLSIKTLENVNMINELSTDVLPQRNKKMFQFDYDSMINVVFNKNGNKIIGEGEYYVINNDNAYQFI